MRLSIDKIQATAKDRPEGYVEDVISRGAIDGEYLEITPEALAELRAIYRPKEPPLPSLPKRAINLAKQSAAEAKAVINGVPAIDPEEAAARIAICRGCDHWRPSDETCSLCGCPMLKKAPWRSAVCPVGKW